MMLRTNLVLLIVLVTFLNYPEQTRAETKLSLKDFFQNSLRQKRKDLKTWEVGERNENRFLGETPGSILINILSILSGIFTIWGWVEGRKIKYEKGKENETDELLEEWNSQLENLNSRMEDFRSSMKQLVCRFDFVHSKTKTVSRECSQFIHHDPKQHHHSRTNVVTPPAKLPYHFKRNNVEKKSTLLETTHLDSLQRLFDKLHKEK